MGWLEVEVLGLSSSQGEVAVALFDSAESFRDGDAPLRAAFLPIEDGACVWRVPGLAPGEYAVKVFHDLDGDGALGVNFLGAPTEPYGFSNGARGALGPPGWRQARFELSAAGGRIAVTVE